MSAKCIYEIFQWTGIGFKYSGCVPLPGLYEWKGFSALSHHLINTCLPILFCLSCFLNSYGTLSFGYGRPFNANLTDLLIALMKLNAGLAYIIFPLVNYFSQSPKLLTYLKLHQQIDPLLNPGKKRLKFYANFTFAVLTLNAYVNYYSLLYTRYKMFKGENFIFESFSALSGLNAVFCITSQPYAMYALLQLILKSAFDQLIRNIEGEKIRVIIDSAQHMADKLDTFSAQYCVLCKLSRNLDEMVSPLMTIRFLHSFIATVYNITFLTAKFSSNNLCIATGIVINFTVIVLVPNLAELTKNSALRVLPTIHSVYKFEDKLVKNKMQILGLQSLHLKVSFSASKFFKLDRMLILAIIQSIISQWVVFYKIKNNT